MAIRMIGLDLDGTTLNNAGRFSERTREAFRKAHDLGAHIIVATGRALCSLPKEIYEMEGLEYVVTSNGARVIETANNETIYLNCIDSSAMDAIYDTLKSNGSRIEVFVDGIAYISQEEFDDVMNGVITHRNKDYVKKTRTPISNIYELLIDCKGKVENINVNYTSQEEKEKMLPHLEKLKGVTLTSSLPQNHELGGLSTSKGDALEFLMNKLGVRPEELMCCGDNPNDIAMIELAGIGVAVGNADREVKDAADFVTLTNDEDGVAYAIEKFVLK